MNINAVLSMPVNLLIRAGIDPKQGEVIGALGALGAVGAIGAGIGSLIHNQTEWRDAGRGLWTAVANTGSAALHFSTCTLVGGATSMAIGGIALLYLRMTGRGS